MTKNYTSFVVSLLVHQNKGGRGDYSRRGDYFKLRPIGRASIQRERLFKGGEEKGELIRGFIYMFLIINVDNIMVYH